MKTKNLFSIVSLSILMITFLSITSCDKLNSINPDNNGKAGDTIWIHQLPQGDTIHYIQSQHLAVGIDGTIYYAAGGLGWNSTNWDPIQIYAVNKTDGKLKWKSKSIDLWHTNSDIVVGDDGTLYVNGYTKLYSINPADGSFNWVWDVPETLPDENGHDVNTLGELGHLALLNNGDLILKTAGSGSYYRADYCIGTAGNMKWYRFRSSFALNYFSIGYDGTIYDFDNMNNTDVLTAFSPENGNVKWSIPVANGDGSNNIIFTGSGNVITLIHPDTLASIDPETGHILWKKATGTYQHYKHMDSHENVILFDQFRGSYLYSAETGNKVKGPVSLPHMIIIDAKDQIYGVLSDNNPHMSVTDEDGTVLWENPSNVVGGCYALTEDKRLYEIISDNRILSLKTDAGIPHSGWPKYTHDNRNTCNVNKW